MSIFKVYDVTIELAKKKAREQISKLPKTEQPRNAEDYEELLSKLAAGIYKTMSPQAVGKPMDAPEFCEELISLARKTTECHSMHIRVHVQKRDKKGGIIISNKTKKPMMTWVRWSEEKLRGAA